MVVGSLKAKLEAVVRLIQTLPAADAVPLCAIPLAPEEQTVPHRLRKLMLLLDRQPKSRRLVASVIATAASPLPESVRLQFAVAKSALVTARPATDPKAI